MQPHDSGRRDRIIDACLEVIARDGVDGTSMRRVATAAAVPLGSMTYHFTSRDDLLREAFERFATSVSDAFETRLAAVDVGDHEALVRALVDVIGLDVFPDPRDQVLTHELYVLAARRPEFRTLTSAWMRRSRTALERHLDPETAGLMDAVIEGVTIHRALEDQEKGRLDPEMAVRRVLGNERTTTP